VTQIEKQIVGDLGPGQIAFYESVRPPLPAQQYRLSATQTVTGLKPDEDIPTYTLNQRFTVAAPRFTLDSSAIQSVYPPAQALGNYADALAHVVLTQRSLPWSRTLDGKPGGSSAPPWIAVLLCRTEELNGATPTRMTVQNVIEPGSGIVGPVGLTVTAEELAQGCLAIDLDDALFGNIAPRQDELQYLAHVREVNTDGKEILGIDADGWFSVIVGNRLPLNPGPYTAILVSLEGQGTHLPGGTAVPTGGKIRLVALASWSFEVTAFNRNFLEIMQELRTRHAPGDPSDLIGIRLLQMPYKMPSVTTDAQKKVKEALDIGFVPLSTALSDGETTVSWYRGPLVPVITKRDQYGPYQFSDHAIRYDPDDGLFDMSYAVAWQIGRLLALSDPAFAQALYDWRIGDFRKTDLAVTRRRFVAQTRLALTLPSSAAALMAQDLGRTAATKFAAHDLAPILLALPHIAKREQKLPAGAFPGVLPKEALDTLKDSDVEPLEWALGRIFGAPRP
jgi:hypothetical protein